MPSAKKCPSCGLYYDDSFKICPYCGSPNYLIEKPKPGSLASAAGKQKTGRVSHSDTIRNPWVALILSILFLGWGQWYNGKGYDGLRYLVAYFAVAIVGTLVFSAIFASLEAVPVMSYVAIILALIGIIAIFAIFIHAAYDSYRTAQRINRGEEEFHRKSRLFWVPVAIYSFLIIVLVILSVQWVTGYGVPHTSSTAPYTGSSAPYTVPASYTSQKFLPEATPGSPSPITTTYPIMGTSLKDLMASPGDLPADFAQPRVLLMTDDDFDSDMRSFGAFVGYKGYYPKTPITNESLWIGHYLIIFPEENAREMVDLQRTKYNSLKSEAKREVYDCQQIGEQCFAQKTAGRNPGDAEYHYHITLSFSKGSHYETFWTVGPDPDYNVIRNLAERSAAKIP